MNSIYFVVIFSTTVSSLSAVGSYTAWNADKAYRAGDFELARRLYEDAVVKDPRDMQSVYNSGKSSIKLKEYPQAEKAFSLVASSPTSSQELKKQALFNRGDAELLQSAYDKALENYNQVLQLDPSNEPAKKRIELIKKLQEQQKQKQNEQKDEQKKDTGKQGGSSSDKKDSQDTEKEKQEGQEKSPAKSGEDSQQDKERRQDDSQKSDQKGDTKQSPKQDSESQRSKSSEVKGADDSQKDQPVQKKANNEKSQERPETDTQKKEHTAPPEKKDSRSEQKEQKHSELAQNTPEKQLNEQERELLEKVEKHDKSVYKAYFAKTGTEKAQTSGQKNW